MVHGARPLQFVTEAKSAPDTIWRDARVILHLLLHYPKLAFVHFTKNRIHSLNFPHGILSIQAHTVDFASLPLTLDGDFLPEIAASAEDADLGDGHHDCGGILSALS